MGDFNDGSLDHGTNQRPWDILESYDSIVSGPTHLDGGQLSCVYLLKGFMSGKKVALYLFFWP